MPKPRSLHLFCHVVDNFGDIGVCWRLARQLASEHSLDVTLWLDDLVSLKRICRALDSTLERQALNGVTVRRWAASLTFVPNDIPDMVIEAFGCDLPASFVAAMAQRAQQGEAPAWVNLEYLSAEDWVEGCHALPSPHPTLPLTKYFFFPGFTDKTGGLLREADLFAQRDAFRLDALAQLAFLAELGVQVPTGACTVSLFCYPTAPVAGLFDAMQSDVQPVLCLVPEGVAVEAVGAFLSQPAVAGARATRGALTVQVIPFVEQFDYDRLLWSCDLNFVRGEDSFVRAQWTALPFVWHIYPQQENAHHAKLDAFLGRYVERMKAGTALVAARFHLAWNTGRDVNALPQLWRDLREALPQLAQHGQRWAGDLSQSGDLATKLLRFVQKIV